MSLPIAPRVQRAWDALAVADRPFELEDDAPDWLAVADADQLDQVLWALLDNAVKYGEGTVSVDDRRRRRTVERSGRPSPTRAAGSSEADGAWLFERFARGAAGRASGNGSGLGPVRVAGAHAVDGRRPRSGSAHTGPWRHVPFDSSRRAGIGGVTRKLGTI